MRLFIALEVPAELQAELGRRMERLRPLLPAARWVRPEGLHLTLCFLGETAPAVLPRLEAALGAAFARHPSFAWTLAGAGTFPPSRPARVAWLGVEAPASLAALQRDVEASACEAAGATPESRAFHPHLTLARPLSPWPREAISAWQAGFAGWRSPAIAVTAGVLMESELGPGGARYRRRAEFPLGGTT